MESKPFYPARDHDRGPGAWCILDKNEVLSYGEVPLPKMYAYMTAHLLNGEIEKFEVFLSDIKRDYGYRLDLKERYKDYVPPKNTEKEIQEEIIKIMKGDSVDG